VRAMSAELAPAMLALTKMTGKSTAGSRATGSAKTPRCRPAPGRA
jgi:hypothetical protein